MNVTQKKGQCLAHQLSLILPLSLMHTNNDSHISMANASSQASTSLPSVYPDLPSQPLKRSPNQKNATTSPPSRKNPTNTQTNTQTNTYCLPAKLRLTGCVPVDVVWCGVVRMAESSRRVCRQHKHERPACYFNMRTAHASTWQQPLKQAQHDLTRTVR